MRHVVPALLVVLLAASACSHGPAKAGRKDGSIVSPGEVGVFDTRPGDCLDLDATKATAAKVTELAAVPCAQEHRYEVFNVAKVDGYDVYPGPTKLASAADGLCLGAFEDYVGIPYLDSQVQFTYLYPSISSWQEEDDRSVVCILVSTEPRTTSLAAAAAGAAATGTGG